MTTGEDPPFDIGKLFPADGEIWAQRSIVTASQAVLLSLNIEPETIDELRAQAGEDEHLNFGLQQVEYEKRVARLKRAVQLGHLGTTQSGTFRAALVTRTFASWAVADGWNLPEWLRALGTSSPSQQGGRIGSQPLRDALIAFAREPVNWKKGNGRETRTQGELCDYFRRSCLLQESDRYRIGYVGSKAPTREHLENILSRCKGDWQPGLREAIRVQAQG
jgi:hypothetical protein